MSHGHFNHCLQRTLSDASVASEGRKLPALKSSASKSETASRPSVSNSPLRMTVKGPEPIQASTGRLERENSFSYIFGMDSAFNSLNAVGTFAASIYGVTSPNHSV